MKMKSSNHEYKKPKESKSILNRLLINNIRLERFFYCSSLVGYGEKDVGNSILQSFRSLYNSNNSFFQFIYQKWIRISRFKAKNLLLNLDFLSNIKYLAFQWNTSS